MKAKLLILLVLILVSIHNIFAQDRNESEGSPLTFGASYIGDLAGNYSGGINRGAVFLGMANLKISFDTEAGGLWKGGSLFLNAASTHGGTPSANLTGDFQGISNIEAGNLTYIHELWLMQSVGEFSVTLGLQDLASNYLMSDNAGLFLNGSFGVHSTLADNVPSPIFPLTSLGVHAQWDASESFTLKAAMFDGLPEDFETNPHNISWRISSRDGIFSITELGMSGNAIGEMPGILKIGAYYHNHLVQAQDGREESYIDNYGIYLLADQIVLTAPEGREAGVFLQAGLSPSHKNENNFYFGAGINYKGVFLPENRDVLGVAVAHAGFHNSIRADETTFELTYKAQLSEIIFIQPDVQYVINPAGADGHLKNALALIIRTGISL